MNKRILVAEDSPAQAALVRADLTEAGFEVTLAATGEDALQCLASRSFDLLLSDVVMPGIDGYELCRLAKHEQPDLPVVLLTSLSDPVEIVHGLEAGADNFLRKPYDPQQLVSRVRQMLYHREMRASGHASMGLEVVLRDRRFLITAERQQILDLLISSFEDLVEANAELRRRERALRDAESDVRAQLTATERERRRISAVLRATPTPIVTTDAQARIAEVNDDFAALVGVPADELVGKPFAEAVEIFDVDGQPVNASREAIEDTFGTQSTVEFGSSFDLFLKGAGGRLLPVIARTAPVRDDSGQLVALATAINDISAFAGHDPITGMPDQALFADRVTRAASDAAPTDRWFAVVAVVVHRLSRVRESVALRAADELLARVADSVRAAVEDVEIGGDRASIAYLGGDVFAAVLTDLDDEVDAVRRSQLLADRLSDQPVIIGDVNLPMTVTVGVAVDGGGAEDPVTLVSAAVAAARRADGTSPRRVEVADASVDARADEWLAREAELRGAIERGQLVIHYQPEIDVRTGEPMGFEALVRWQHPERGLLGPGEFLPLAQESGLIAPLGWTVLDMACRQVAAWQQSELPSTWLMTLSVNLDPSQLAEPDVAERVRAIVDATGLDPTSLILEITEHGVTVDAQASAHQLLELKRLGVRIAIDDFGTGYSSLAQLRRFPVDFLKIDRSFINGMIDEPEDAAIVAATARLARTLGIDTIAEGVETEDQLVKLRLLECDFAQGYYWAKPMPAAELERWWEAHASNPTRPLTPPPDAVDARDAVDSRLDDLITYLAHELRSPLSVIMGWTTLALEQAPVEMERYLAPVLRQAVELEHRVATLAEMRDAAHGAMPLALAPTDIVPVLATLIADMADQLAPHEVRLCGAPSAWCRVDTSRLTQAVTNLLVNAAKFSPIDSPIDVEVQTTGDQVEIGVIDRGPGVPEERRPELFRRFARLGSRHTGMGVGLYLVRAIARAHGGDARYNEVSDGGSRFSIALPRTTTP